MSPATDLPRESRNLIPADSPLAPFIWVDPGRMHGEPCFTNTRIPVQTLFDMLADGASMEEFLEGFTDVEPAHAAAVLRLSALGLLEGLRNL